MKYSYGRDKRIIEVIGLVAAMAGYLALCGRCLAYNPGYNLIWLVPLMYFTAGLAADFSSGLLHFIGDNPISENRWLGKWFYTGFYNHHVDPVEMTQHDFITVNGYNAIATCFILLPSLYFLPPAHTLLTFGITLFVVFYSGLILMTNQIHKWAHTSKPTKSVKFLQKSRLILSPRNHIKHHIKHDKYYCITTGWLNELFYKSQFFERLTGLGK